MAITKCPRSGKEKVAVTGRFFEAEKEESLKYLIKPVRLRCQGCGKYRKKFCKIDARMESRAVKPKRPHSSLNNK